MLLHRTAPSVGFDKQHKTAAVFVTIPAESPGIVVPQTSTVIDLDTEWQGLVYWYQK